MNQKRAWSAAATFEGNDQFWWITGGSPASTYNVESTELYDATTNEIQYYADLPIQNDLHSLVNVNDTHTVMLGGRVASRDVYVFDR